MASQVHHRPLLLLMAGAALVMACIVYAEIRARPVIERVALSEGAGEIRVPPLPKPRTIMPAKETFAVIVERPLFSPSRRPPAEGTAATPTPAPDFSLFGIVISAGEPFALVKPGAGGDPVRITEGASMSGWTVSRIESDRIMIWHGTTQQELLLDFSAPAPASATEVPNDATADSQVAPADQDNAGTANASDGEQAPQPEAEEPESADQSQAN
jgi:hypothetical protein